MLITRTPLRVTLAGGGTDLPSYFSRRPGFVISAAIDKYVFIGLNRTFTDDYFLKYSALERVAHPDDIEHPIIRTALQLHAIGPSLEIVSLADIPAGTGLGSSGSFTVGLLRALYAWKREHVTAGDLAEEACRVEIDLLGRPVGKQDQYIAAFGGVTCFEFHEDGRVPVSPLDIRTSTMHELEERLLMFFTGSSRTADAILDDQRRRTEEGDESMIESMRRVEEIGLRIRDALESGDVTRLRRAHARALAREARAHPGHVQSRHRPLVRAGDRERGRRRQAHWSRGRRVSALPRGRSGAAPRGDEPPRGSRRCGSVSTTTARASSFVPERKPGRPGSSILAGGPGNAHATTSRGDLPKALILFAGEPFAHHQLRLLASQGVQEVVLRHRIPRSGLRRAIGDGSRFGLQRGVRRRGRDAAWNRRRAPLRARRRRVDRPGRGSVRRLVSPDRARAGMGGVRESRTARAHDRSQKRGSVGPLERDRRRW